MEIQSAIGRILAVRNVAGDGILLDLALEEHLGGDTKPLLARAKWCSPYAGNGFGEWHLPEVGRAVVVHFPHAQTHGAVGGDLDNGYAAFYVPFSDAPQVNGVDAALSQSVRVLRGKTGVAEQRETGGALKWFLRAAATFIHDALLRFQGPTVEFESVTWQVTASTSIDLTCAVVRAGNGTRYRLMDERVIPFLVGHVHSGVTTGGSNTGAPTTSVAVGTHTTTHQTSS